MSLETLVKGLGLTDEDITALSAEGADLTPITQKVTDSIKAKILEDEAFYNTLDKNRLPKDWFDTKFNEGVQKVAGMGKSAIDKHFGLTSEDKATFSDDELKDIAKYTAKATQIFKTKVGGDNKDVATLQDEIITLKQELDGRKTEIASLQTKFDSDLAEKLTAKELETLSLIEASHLQAHVPVPVGIIFDKAFASVKSKYSVVVENGIASIRKKDNPTFKVEKADKSGHMELKDALAEAFKELQSWKDVAPTAGSQAGRTTVTIDPSKSSNSEAFKKKQAEEDAFFS
jgi:hypothetical protein